MKQTEKTYKIELTEKQIRTIELALWRSSNDWSIEALKEKDTDKASSLRSIALNHRDTKREIKRQVENQKK